MGKAIKKGLVFTNENCIGCNRCISVCPVLTANMAVMDENGGEQKIYVDGDSCISCGACFDVCEHNAREYEDDTERFFADLKKGERISLLLAPAFLANYPKEYASILGGLKELGANRIISISFGADITTWAYIQYITQNQFMGGISQPCPAIVGYIEKYIPSLISHLMPVHSPMMCGAIYARKYLGISDKLAFISPCIAKKNEIEDPDCKGYISYNVTFDHLMDYVHRHGISGAPVKDEIEYGLGSIYPMPGGLKENVYWFCGEDMFIRQIEGEKHAYHFLQEYEKRIGAGKELPFMVDALNCSNGCIYGTGVERDREENDDTLFALQKIRSESKKKNGTWGADSTPEKRLKSLNRQFSTLKLSDFIRNYTDRSGQVGLKKPDKQDMELIFQDMEKRTEKDKKVNCGACGYGTCRDMATAIYNDCNNKHNCIQFVKHEVEEEKDTITEITNEMKDKNLELGQRNQEILELVGSVNEEFAILKNSIENMSADNESNAQESNNISQSMAGVKEFTEKLSAAIQEIGELLNSLEANNNNITSIANKTNLLSLNASIEAARAGEMGKGFAVVAQNIKQLSDSSKSTAADSNQNKVRITQAMEVIQDEISRLMAIIEEVDGRISHLADGAHEIAESAGVINETSNSVYQKIQSLSNE